MACHTTRAQHECEQRAQIDCGCRCTAELDCSSYSPTTTPRKCFSARRVRPSRGQKRGRRRRRRRRTNIVLAIRARRPAAAVHSGRQSHGRAAQDAVRESPESQLARPLGNEHERLLVVAATTVSTATATKEQQQPGSMPLLDLSRRHLHRHQPQHQRRAERK